MEQPLRVLVDQLLPAEVSMTVILVKWSSHDALIEVTDLAESAHLQLVTLVPAVMTS